MLKYKKGKRRSRTATKYYGLKGLRLLHTNDSVFDT